MASGNDSRIKGRTHGRTDHQVHTLTKPLANGRAVHTWLVRLLERRKPKVAAIALANKNARIAWAMMMRGDRYREPMAIAA